MKPTIGRVVLFTLYSHEQNINGMCTFPAIVTMVHGDREGAMVNLRLVADCEPGDRQERYTSVEYADVPGQPGTWTWPPRV